MSDAKNPKQCGRHGCNDQSMQDSDFCSDCDMEREAEMMENEAWEYNAEDY